MDPLIQFKKTTLLVNVGFTVACFAISPIAQAVVPAPDGGYPGGNTAEGQKALFSLTTGGFNAAIGYFSLFANSTGSFNTALGAGALDLNTADENTATGAGALLSNTTGAVNTANGAFALFSNTTGNNNTAAGYQALFGNTTGSANTAFGTATLFANTGERNTAVGVAALFSNTTGIQNTATGYQALFNNTTGQDNTANGDGALYHNTTGSSNTANGDGALVTNTIGSNNTALGYFAGVNVTTANNVICIGADGNNVDNSCYIGNIFGSTSSGGIAVFINSNGRLGTMTSSARFKDEIKPMDKASEAILALKPVTFRYKHEIDRNRIPQFGLVAEEVEKVNPDLVVRDKEGKPYSVRYDQVNAMLLNEFLKEHRTVQEQEATITQLKKDFRATVAQLTARLDEQASQIQKVSAQLATASPSRGGLEASKFAIGRIRRGGTAPQVVNNQ